MLQDVARRLVDCFRERDTIARLGGDEFAIVLPKVGDEENAAVAAARVVRAISLPFRQGDLELKISVRVGVARLRALLDASAEHFETEERLMAQAGFRGLEVHRREHRRILVDLEALAGHAEHLSASITKNVLHRWLLGHLNSYDRLAATANRFARRRASNATAKDPALSSHPSGR